ncbi:hypothetical protein AGMMS49925_08080 [Deltaproteobacteria bacterium]|nr:hypothetical protein AGMMS49925_08080 [Deltaproteobacteria bacterium]
MLRHVLTIRKLGREARWLLAQQTIGMRSAKERSDFMLGRSVVHAITVEQSIFAASPASLLTRQADYRHRLRVHK